MMRRALAVVALSLTASCAHVTAQLITHASEIAAYGAAAAAAAQGLSMLNQADELAKRVEKRAEDKGAD